MANEVIKGCGYHHFGLRVCDYEKSVEFYTKGLGFVKKVEFDWQEKYKACMLDMGDGGCLEVFGDGTAEDHFGGKWQHLALQVADCDQAFEAALKAGAEPDQYPADKDIQSFDGVLEARIGFVKGPDGERIELFQYRK